MIKIEIQISITEIILSDSIAASGLTRVGRLQVYHLEMLVLRGLESRPRLSAWRPGLGGRVTMSSLEAVE